MLVSENFWLKLGLAVQRDNWSLVCDPAWPLKQNLSQNTLQTSMGIRVNSPPPSCFHSTENPVSILLVSTNPLGFNGQGFGGELKHQEEATQVTLPYWKERWSQINRDQVRLSYYMQQKHNQSVSSGESVWLDTCGNVVKLRKHLLVWFRLWER